MSNSDGGPAFPADTLGVHVHHGMTLRDRFAGQALAGLLAASKAELPRDTYYARLAYQMADAMLAARKTITLQPNQVRNVAQELEAAQAEIERLRDALQSIADRHIPDQPAAVNVDELTWAKMHVGKLRTVAVRALKGDSE